MNYSTKQLWRWMGVVGGLAIGITCLHAPHANATVEPVIFNSSSDWLSRLQRFILESRWLLFDFLVRFIYVIGATILLRLSLYLIRRYYPRIYRWIYHLQKHWIPSLKIQNLELISAEAVGKGLIIIARGFRFIILGLLFYLYLPFLLNLSPWTQQFGELLFTSILSGFSSITLGILSYIPNLITLGLIIIISYYLLQFSNKIFTEVEKGNLKIPGFYPVWANPTAKILGFLIISFAAVLAFPYLPGGSSPALQGISLFAGVLVSLGSTAVIGNLVSGIVLIYTRAFDKGDRVTIAGVTGDVVEEALLVTRIRTIKNKVVTIPNSMVIGNYIVNFSKNKNTAANDDRLIVHVTITLGYDISWRKVHEVLIAAAKATEHLLAEPSPFVLQTALNDFYVHYEINAYTDHPTRTEIIESELYQNIQDQCNAADIEILSPHYAAMRDGNQSTIPADYLPADYVAPSFQVGLGLHPATQLKHPQKQ